VDGGGRRDLTPAPPENWRASADGQVFAYQEKGTNDIHVVTVSSGANRLVAHSGSLYRPNSDCSGAWWVCTGAVWSPDDSAIALIVGPPNRGYLVARADGGKTWFLPGDYRLAS